MYFVWSGSLTYATLRSRCGTCPPDVAPDVALVGTDLTDVVLAPQVIRRRHVRVFCRPEFYGFCAFFTRKMGNFTVI